jgi:UDPglucose 6-dehydrogenase
MEIGVIGAGHVGLTTAAGLAAIGHQVWCADGPENVASLRSGEIPFFEPYLAEIVGKQLAASRLRFTTAGEAVRLGRALFICVGTPPLENGEADLSEVEQVAQVIAQEATSSRLVIQKSTVPVHTGRWLQQYLKQHGRADCEVASNPEFMREGSALEAFFHPDRIVVGAESPRAVSLLKAIYGPVISGQFTCPVHDTCSARGAVPFVAMDLASAELVKLASNSFLATKISFINLMADLCEATGADVQRVAEAMGLDPRIGPAFLRPGIGFGGFCLPKDLAAFVKVAERFGCDFSLLREVEKVNRERVDRFVNRIRAELGGLRARQIAAWGLAFKPNTDDLRNSPALAVVRNLVAEGAKVRAYDPQATERALAELPALQACADPYEAARNAEAILVLTDWEEFQRLDWRRLKECVSHPLVVDGRNVLSGDQLARHGFRYVSIGRVSAGQVAAALTSCT